MTDQETRLILGMMSGTSCDGVSLCLVRASGPMESRRYEALRGGEVAFPKSLRDQVFALYPPNAFTAHTLLRTHLALGRFMGEAALQFLREAREQVQADAGAGVRAQAGAEAKADAGVESRTEVQAKSKAEPEADFTEGVTAISMHGPVIYHDPPSELNQGQGGQIELGEASLVAEITGIMTLSQLRASDTAAGGHGAPLSSFADYLLFKDPVRGRAIQNLGGIANVTPIYPGMKASEVISFDTGPANMVIDAVTHLLTGGEEQMDRDGIRAARGQVDPTLLAELLAHPYFQQSPPKTTGREMFGLPYAHDVIRRGGELGLSTDDVVATVTMLTAKSLKIAYEKFVLPRGPIEEVVLGGGGTRNPTLVRMIREELAPLSVVTHEDYGIPNEQREALTWAIIADHTLSGRPGNLPHATGASHPVVMGKVAFGNGDELRPLRWPPQLAGHGPWR